MKFDLKKSIDLLIKTPVVLDTLLSNLDDDWLRSNEGENTWSPFDVLGHLIHGEKTDWIPRAKIILSDAEDKTFIPFDRFAQLEDSKGKSMADLLEEFKQLRLENLQTLVSWKLSPEQLELSGTHPELGKVLLKELLATWVAHDLNHLKQISRVMAWQLRAEIGPWKKYMPAFK